MGQTAFRVISLLFLLGSLSLFLIPAWRDQSFSQSRGNTAAGKTTYEKWCASCHGKSGEGLGNMPSFQNADFMSSRTNPELYNSITRGIGGTGMPPFSKLSEEDRWNVVAYIRTLSSPQ